MVANKNSKGIVSSEGLSAYNNSMIKLAIELGKRIKAVKVLILPTALPNLRSLGAMRVKKKVIFMVTKKSLFEKLSERGYQVLLLPFHNLSRIGKVTQAMRTALDNEYINESDPIVCLTGVPGSTSMDTIMSLVATRGFQDRSLIDGVRFFDKMISPVIERVLSIAVEIGYEGHEGNPVGSLFIVGDSETVMAHSSQLTFNPCQGYPERERNIMDPEIKEAIKEFSTIDGGFVLREDCVVLSAGRYLEVGSRHGIELPKGLGTRHASAAAITKISEAIAITVSQSNGQVRMFRGGRLIYELEQIRRIRI